MRVLESLGRGSQKTFLIDSGTTQNFVSQNTAHKIGLRPTCNAKFEVAWLVVRNYLVQVFAREFA